MGSNADEEHRQESGAGGSDLEYSSDGRPTSNSPNELAESYGPEIPDSQANPNKQSTDDFLDIVELLGGDGDNARVKAVVPSALVRTEEGTRSESVDLSPELHHTLPAASEGYEVSSTEGLEPEEHGAAQGTQCLVPMAAANSDEIPTDPSPDDVHKELSAGSASQQLEQRSDSAAHAPQASSATPCRHGFRAWLEPTSGKVGAPLILRIESTSSTCSTCSIQTPELELRMTVDEAQNASLASNGASAIENSVQQQVGVGKEKRHEGDSTGLAAVEVADEAVDDS